MNSTSTSRLLLLASCLLWPALAGADKPSKTFEDTTQVVEVQVPVNVTDRDGEPVRGLSADHFELWDEKEKRTIDEFEVVDLEVLTSDDSTAAGDLDPDAIPSAARRHILLLFDLSFSKPTSVLRARQAARDFVLNRLDRTDLAAVATHSVDTGARLLITFTPDRAQLVRAIDTLGFPRLLNLAQRQDPLRFLIEDPSLLVAAQGSGSSQVSGGLLNQQILEQLTVVGTQMEKWEKSFARGRISTWTNSLTELATMLDAVKGRKHVIYFSEGFDGRLLLGRQPDPGDPRVLQDRLAMERGQFWLVDTDDMFGNSALQNDVDHMLKTFQQADAIIHAVDIAGLGRESVAGESGGRHRVGQDALFYIANETGGAFLEDGNRFENDLPRILARSEVTYLLTFRASDVPTDGSYRRLRIKVDSPGAHVSHRAGYFAPRPFEQLHPIERNLLASDAIASAAERKEVDMELLVAPFRATDQIAYVPVIIEVDGASLLAGHREGNLAVEFYTYVTNDKGEMRDFFTQLVSLDLAGGRGDVVRELGIKYYGHLELEPGTYLVRTLVRNADTGRTGVETARLSIPAYADEDPILLPPFFIDTDAPRRWVLVREKRADAYQKSMIYPFTVNGQPYIPAARPFLRSEQEAHLCLVGYNFGHGELTVEGKVESADGAVIEGGGELSVVERTVTGIAGLDKLLATFRPDGLTAGEYTLQVAVTDAASGLREVSRIPFRIQ